MQLVAYGAQDIYLTGNPQITFFKVVYRRHTNFSMEAIEQTWSGGANTSEGRCQTTISRNGDLIHKMYIQVDMDTAHNPMVKTGVNNPGAYFIKDVELEIGGQSIDKQTGLWMELWAELTEPNPSCTVGSTNTRSYCTSFQNMTMSGGVSGQTSNASTVISPGPLLIPLRFWFCRNPGLALPLIALQYHEVKVTLEHRLQTVFPGNSKQSLWVDYIYLDTDERRRFAQVSHEYLIEQLQYQSVSSTETSLRFNHPVKELVWCNNNKMKDDGTSGLTFDQAVDCGEDGILLKLNGHDRFAQRKKQYFTRQQVYDYHSGAGGLYHYTGIVASSGGAFDSIAVYSFALKPEEHQPSGTCNFSRIDNAQLTGLNSEHTIFAVNYNVLRIMSGMGGLAYSN